MQQKTSTGFAFAVALAALGADGHMIMNKPIPYNYKGQAPLLQTSPLGPNFPFPNQGLSRVVEMNKYRAGGDPIEVQFTGSAMHKGGSCQFSVAAGSTPPSDPKAWKVIASIIGGCPGETDGEGNLPNDGTDADGRPDGKQCSSFGEKECHKTFKIPVPPQLANGVYSFAWTWFNYVGNREMYMNAAPMEISGGADEASGKAFLDGLPSMFVANVEGNPISTCTTAPGVLSFPEPGKIGMVIQTPTQASSGTCQVPAALSPNFENDIRALQDGGASPANPSTTTTPYQGGGTDSSRIVPTTFSTIVKAPETAAPPVPTDNSSGDKPDVAEPSSGRRVACPTNGALICIGEDMFGICDRGFALPQALAPGTACNAGQIVRRSL